jgi:Putative zinc-finger
MSHVDEGTLHALLDGELAPAEVLEVQTHFATCPACSSRLTEARKLLAETERLVSALEPAAPLGGQFAPRMGRPAAEPPPPAPPPPAAPRPFAPPRPAFGMESPVLIPNNPTVTEVRRGRLRVMGWAAGFLVVVGAGVIGLQVQMGLFDKKPVGMLKLRPEEFSSPIATDARAASPVAAATPETRPNATGIAPIGTAPGPGRDAATGAAGNGPPPTPPASAQPTASTQPAAPARAPAPAPTLRPTSAPAAQSKPPAPAATAPPETKAQDKRPVQAKEPEAKEPEAKEPEAKAPERTPDTVPTAEDREAIVARAAKATEDLDRERNRERAAAATEALDAERKRAAAAQQAAAAAATPPPAPVPTIDQRSQIANRIGLDEAARQLGGPLHAIDGMSRLLVGVVSPQLVPGTDTTRAVVRAVYVDRSGRLVFLDQQRARPGQPDLPPPYTPRAGRNGELRWMAGQVLIVLQSDQPTDSLRLLYRRIR